MLSYIQFLRAKGGLLCDWHMYATNKLLAQQYLHLATTVALHTPVSDIRTPSAQNVGGLHPRWYVKLSFLLD